MSKNNNSDFQKAIKDSLTTLRPGINNGEMAPPPGWKIIKVTGDGSCGYHAIMKSLYIMDRIKFNDFKNRNMNNNDQGFWLRDKCTELLEKILNDINTFLFILKDNTINSKNSIKEDLKNIIKNFRLDSFMDNFNINNFIKNKNIINSVENFLKKEKNETSNYTRGEFTTKYIQGYTIYIIQKILNKNIFIYFPRTKQWIANQIIENANPNNSLFIIYNGNHYDTLQPIKKLKDNFNNMPNTQYFNYNFIKREKNI